MKREREPRLFIIVPLLMVLLFLSGCEGNATAIQNAPEEIVIGASIPKSGALDSFGLYEAWGYAAAVDEINAQGGLYLSQYHTKIPVRLITYDDKSSSDQSAKNIDRLINQDKVDVLLGSATPPLVMPGAGIAEKYHVPMVTGIAPIRSFMAGNPGWKYVWDIFFDELDMTKLQFSTMDTVTSNHKVALFTDDEQDGKVMGQLWEQNASKYNYTVVYHAQNIKVGATDFASYINAAKASQAEIIITQLNTPDAISMWKQMKLLNYRPKAAFLEKGAEPTLWTSALPTDGQNVMVAGYWYPTLPYPGARELRQRFELDTGLTYGQHIADTYSAAQILLDAIARAGSLNKVAINNAIGQTHKTYVVGPVNFAKGPGDHTSVLPS
ncbi:MAG TPA: amino acid ABC transporter substrate-binding protein, partial [Ktedonobacteraceae bacterium]|nr:amino acid ABC transporter substrate-binding protein [Ktedonobacteraceae bacterium]